VPRRCAVCLFWAVAPAARGLRPDNRLPDWIEFPVEPSLRTAPSVEILERGLPNCIGDPPEEPFGRRLATGQLELPAARSGLRDNTRLRRPDAQLSGRIPPDLGAIHLQHESLLGPCGQAALGSEHLDWRERAQRLVGFLERPVVTAVADNAWREDVVTIAERVGEDVLLRGEASIMSPAEQAAFLVEGAAGSRGPRDHGDDATARRREPRGCTGRIGSGHQTRASCTRSKETERAPAAHAPAAGGCL
jgi:hypothetical protein